MTFQTHEDIIAESNAQIVSKVNGRDVTRGELSAAFDLVKNPKGWKEHINARAELTDEQVNVIDEAVIFFTGSVAEFRAIGKPKNGKQTYRVRAAGYYRTIGS